MKKAIKYSIIPYLILLVLCLGGCGRQTLFEGGEDYPYSLRETGNGRMVLKLDGSKSPDEMWVVEAADESWYAQPVEEQRRGKLLGGGKKSDREIIKRETVSVKQSGREHKGKAQFVLRPVELCDGCIVTVRRQKKGSGRVSAAMNLLLKVEPNRAGNGLAIRFVSCEQEEPASPVLLSKIGKGVISCREKEGGDLVLTLPYLKDLEMQVENTDAVEDGQWTANLSQEEAAEILGEEVKEELSEDAVRALLDVTNSDETPWLGAQVPEEGLCWYQDPNCHIGRGSYGIGKDGEMMLITFFGKSKGSCRVNLKSESLKLSVTFVIDVDENGHLSTSGREEETGNAE